jgi:hypothetical protein
MNIYISGQIAELKDKLNAYVTMLSYRFSNLCVKAELGALMPVTVITEEEHNLEDVAKIAIPEENQFEIYPNLNHYTQQIIDGIFEVHPEFKLEMKQDEGSNAPQATHLLYTMPEVDKDRRKLLTDMADVCHKECLANIEETCVHYADLFADVYDRMNLEEVQELKDVLSYIRNDYKKKADDKYMDKIDEIDEAYDRFVDEKEARDAETFDYRKSMRLDYDL